MNTLMSNVAIVSAINFAVLIVAYQLCVRGARAEGRRLMTSPHDSVYRRLFRDIENKFATVSCPPPPRSLSRRT
jgi:hypothetical protein